MNNRPQLAGAFNRGFTLLEILLVLVLLLLFFGAAVFEFDSMGRGASLSDGANRLESLFRFARSEAERTGRKIRIRFTTPDDLALADDPLLQAVPTSNASGPIAEWELDPLEQPGQFARLPHSVHFTDGVDNLVIIESVERTDPDSRLASQLFANAAIPDSGERAAFGPEEPPTVFFYPDGSCDSVKVHLADRNQDNPNKAYVELIGLTGTVHREIIELTPEQPNASETNNVARTSQPLGQAQPEP